MRALLVVPLCAVAVGFVAAPAAASPPGGSPASCAGIRSSVDGHNGTRDDVAVFFAHQNPAGLPNIGLYYQPVAHAHAGTYQSCTALTPPLAPPAHP